MKITKSELIESIKALNEKKPLKESADIQRVLFPADADAQEQHEQALKANKERLDPKNYAQDVKDLVKMTASEESRYSHFDVVDRRELAKQINEAKEKGLPFRVSRSTKEGFRYNLDVLKEEFLKKDAGNPDVNTAAFNKATNVGNGPIAEEYKLPTEDNPEYINALAKAYKALNENDKAAGVIYGYERDEDNNKFVPFFAMRDTEKELGDMQASLRSKKKGPSKITIYTLFPQKLDDTATFLKEKGALPKLKKKRVVEDLEDSPEAKEVWAKSEEIEGELPEDFFGKIEFLVADEEEAIEGYDKVILALSDEKYENVRKQLEIIRDEEVAHKEFLENVKEDLEAIYVDPSEAEEGEEELEDEKEEEPLTEDLDEELKVFTSTLSGFHPSEKSEGLWNEIKDANKVEDLEYALEALYPDGISDVALDDMLSNEPDWIRDMIGLDEPEVEEEEPIDEFEDEEIEPLDDEESSDDDWTEEPFEESEEEDEIEEPMDDDIDGLEQREVDKESSDEELDDLDDEEPVEIDDEDLEEKPESKEEEPIDEFKTKKAADAQRKAMFANGYKRLDEEGGKKVFKVTMTGTSRKDEEELGIKGLRVTYNISAGNEKEAKAIARKFDSGKRVVGVEVLEEKPESKEEEKAEKEHPLDESFCKDCDDEQTAKLADGFVNKQFKQNEISEEEATPKKEIAETLTDTDEDEIVAIDDSSVEDMLGMPKSEKK